jgi:hypothetical protein
MKPVEALQSETMASGRNTRRECLGSKRGSISQTLAFNVISEIGPYYYGSRRRRQAGPPDRVRKSMG